MSQKELKRRCRKFTDPIDSVFEHLFLLATSLDPRYRLLLNAIQVSAAKTELLKEIRANTNGSSPPEGQSPRQEVGEEMVSTEVPDPPPTKKFRHWTKS